MQHFISLPLLSAESPTNPPQPIYLLLSTLTQSPSSTRTTSPARSSFTSSSQSQSASIAGAPAPAPAAAAPELYTIEIMSCDAANPSRRRSPATNLL